MKTATRLTKKAILEEVRTLRSKIDSYTAMSMMALVATFKAKFGSEPNANCSRDVLIRDLLMQSTFYLTNVLNIE